MAQPKFKLHSVPELLWVSLLMMNQNKSVPKNTCITWWSRQTETQTDDGAVICIWQLFGRWYEMYTNRCIFGLNFSLYAPLQQLLQYICCIILVEGVTNIALPGKCSFIWTHTHKKWKTQVASSHICKERMFMSIIWWSETLERRKSVSTVCPQLIAVLW